MKRLIALFFLSLFLLYHVGYLGYYWYSARQINERWLVQVEVTPDMKHVSIPIALPYWTETEYRPAHGTITIDGKQYRAVMEKYSKDALHLILAEDHAAQKLDQSISEWIKMMNATNSESSNEVNFLKSVAKDYLADQPLHIPERLYALVKSGFYHFDSALQCQSMDILTPPPRA